MKKRHFPRFLRNEAQVNEGNQNNGESLARSFANQNCRLCVRYYKVVPPSYANAAKREFQLLGFIDSQTFKG